MIIGNGSARTALDQNEIQQIVIKTLDSINLQGKSVLAIIPDSTRTCPIQLMFKIISESLKGKAKKLDYLIALGTHPPMDEKAIDKLVGCTNREREQYGVRVFNHMWKDPKALRKIGTITEEEVEQVTSGLFRMKVSVEINAMVKNYDQILICGPVFPHEVVGMSGGYKYFFPGICGSEFLNFFHWVGAMITNPRIIGNKNTPVRDLINLAARFIQVPVAALCVVVHHQKLHGLYAGDVNEAWSKAADLAAQLEMVALDRPFQRVLSCAPEMYDDLWTGGKCMYKMENVVADGGELIIYAPHITEISYTHGKVLDEVGYHVRDYFRKQWDRFQHFPWGVLAHSTHVRGIGTFENGQEQGRVTVTLATGIPPERCRQVNLGYLDPQSVRVEEWANRESEGLLLVRRAGEVLYRLKNPPAWAK